METLRNTIRVSVAVLILAAGAALMVGMIRTKPAAPSANQEPRLPLVEIIRVEPVEETAPVVVYGTARPKDVIQILPQTAGRLVRVHPLLAVGKNIPQGELLFEIDDTVHQAAVRQAEAEVAALQTALQRNTLETATLTERIAHAERLVALDQADHQSALLLLDEEKIGNRRDVDLLFQKALRQESLLTELRAAYDALPLLRKETEARLEASEARVVQARHELQNTRILCPFHARVEQALIRETQVVVPGTVLAVLSRPDSYEITVAVDPVDVTWLHSAVQPAALSKATSAAAPTARVTCAPDGFLDAWNGRVARFERIDELTRTVRIVVEVDTADRSMDAHSDRAKSGLALTSGAYCRVELPVEPRSDFLRLPRSAVVDEHSVYVVEPSPDSPGIGRLAARTVTIRRRMDEFVLVDQQGAASKGASELKAGDQLVVSPPANPVPGMPIRVSPR